MIENLSKFANMIKDKEIDKIQDFLNIVTHPGMRGDMFEGITTKIINNTIGKVPLIHVCEGLVKNNRTGQISKQMDLIIYINDCVDIPNSTSKIVSIDNVIAIIEVKKSFHKAEFLDFYKKQLSVKDLVDEHTPLDKELFIQLKTSIFGRSTWNGDKENARSTLERYLYHTLLLENQAPLRICFGYEGITKEETLRENLLEILNEINDNDKKHIGANYLPSLVISEDNCLVKMIGFPFCCQYSEPFQIMSSYKGDTLRVLLTMLISKIESKTDIRFKFESDDFSKFKFNDFLSFTLNDEGNVTIYYPCKLTISESNLNKSKMEKWAPVEITDYENLVVSILCKLSYEKNPILTTNDEIFQGHNLQAELSNLIKNGFIYIYNENVELISTECQVVIWDGKFYIGENVAGQMTQWINEQIKINKKIK